MTQGICSIVSELLGRRSGQTYDNYKAKSCDSCWWRPTHIGCTYIKLTAMNGPCIRAMNLVARLAMQACETINAQYTPLRGEELVRTQGLQISLQTH